MVSCNENPSIALFDVYFLIQLVYGIPSLFVWTKIIKTQASFQAILIDRSHDSFSHPFHQVLAVTGIISVVVFVNDMIFTRFLLTGRFCAAISAAFSTYSYWLSPTVFIAMYGSGCQARYCSPSIGSQPCSQFVIRRYLIPALSISYAKIIPGISTTLYSIIIYALGGTIIVVINAATLVCFKRMRRQKVAASHAERTIFIRGLFQSASLLILVIYQLAMYLLVRFDLDLKVPILFTLRSFFWDILTLLPAWVTFLTNEPIRRAFRRKNEASMHKSSRARSSGWVCVIPPSRRNTTISFY